MQLELIFTNESRVLPGIAAFTRETLKQWPLDETIATKLGDCVVAAAKHAIEFSYPPGESGSIELTVREAGGKLEFIIRDHGLPQDVAALEKRLHDPSIPASEKIVLHWPGAEVVDELHWLGFGREGKAIQIIKWLHDEHVTDQADAAALAPFNDEAPLAPPQEYTIRRMLPEEAVQVSQLIYRAYGSSYLNEDVYYPDRVAALNASNTNISFVAVGADGRLAGHYALERDEPGPVVEGGQAVVDPAHRGRGLLDRMKDAALDEARRLNFVGVFGDAVTAHTRTQQSDIKHGAHLTCINLAIAPQSMSFRNISTELPQRLTCALFFQWLQPAQGLQQTTPRTIFAPERHGPILTMIYDNLKCPVEFGTPIAPTGHGTLTVEISSAAACAVLRADLLGADTAQLIRHAKREIIEHSHVEVVYVDLPLADPGTPAIATELESAGFGFLGVAPHFSLRGDILRMAYLVEPLQRAPIKTADDFTAELVDYALAEQARVQSTL
jgi:anti-sigma regulatory factor (Ser/Thr protein kinase)/GNAT superfamily N-acetyltransferase